MDRVRSRLLLAATAVLAGALAFGAIACDDDEDDGEEATATQAAEGTEPAAAGEIPELAIGASDYAFDAPASIAGGLTRVTVTNNAEMEDHQAQLLKLNEGVSYEQFEAALPQGEEGIIPLVAPAGGPGAGAGLENSNVLDLEPGTYALICLIPSPDDGVPHAAKGMLQELEVTEPAAEQPEAPAADVSVGLSDFMFDAPDTLPAGETTFDVTNNGPQPHEMALLSLQAGTTADQALEILLTPPGSATPSAGPPPFTFVGQMAVLSSGGSGLATIDFDAGTYLLLCFVTDPESGMPHVALGMEKELTVE